MLPSGEEGIRELGVGLKAVGIPFKSAYSSDSGRTIQTMDIILRETGFESPTLLFVGPVLFGGFTLLFLISGLIRLFLNLAAEGRENTKFNTQRLMVTETAKMGSLIGLSIIAFCVACFGSEKKTHVMRIHVEPVGTGAI